MMIFEMILKKTSNPQNDDAKPVYRKRWQSSTRDYRVIQIKDENRRIKMILRATNNSTTPVMGSPPAGLKRPASTIRQGSVAKKRRTVGVSQHARYRHSIAKAVARSVKKPTVNARKRLLPLDEEPCEPKRPCVTAKEDCDGETQGPSLDDDWFIQVGLSAKDVEILYSGEWLTDDHVTAAQKLLRRQFPALAGLQEPVLGEILQFEPMTKDGAQVMLNGGGHWVTVCRKDGEVKLLDSKNGGLTPKLSRQIVNLCGEKKEERSAAGLRVQLPVVHPQRGSSDCGLFALAYATEVAYGGSPELAVFDQRAMRQHLRRCLESQKMTPFPRMSCAQRTPRNVGNKSQTIRS
ncbi:uncharacterized protein LOC119721064 [Patiria miniata]|uniref:Ubiquitin-like protease family profile domain-containing protein n=1 Tax=Patiria miniata TaxID=46514 RepID=A0A913Z4X4_PATMI|nr:uncharacterized protein LOC119721064 [Patiria miniata]